MSQRAIASSCDCSRNTVISVLNRAQERDISWPLPNDLTNGELHNFLFPEKKATQIQKTPDFEYIHKELAKKGVTLTLLWDEYCQKCHQTSEIPYMYTQFCFHYRKYANVTKATLRIRRKPGEVMEVDWAGATAFLKDNLTGEKIPAYIFVATLPCTQYTYVEACLSQNTEHWILAHIHAFNYFGGIPEMIVPDNLRTGVDRSSLWDPKINRTYYEMAEYYQTAVVPARVRKPRDKASVEGNVGTVSTWIIAALRHQTFFTIGELNESVSQKLEEYNQKPFQKKTGSRQLSFLEEEKFALLPIPARPFELASWKQAIVPLDYHVVIDKNHYSLPYEYVKHEVEIRTTPKVIEVFYNHMRIASHLRIVGKENQFVTIPEHMPDNHRMYIEWDKEYILQWAHQVGESTHTVVNTIYDSSRVEKQAQKMCMGIMKLADKYSLERLEEACQQALLYSPSPQLNSLKTILKHGTYHQLETKKEKKKVQEPNPYGFVRGAGYFGGKTNDK